MSERIKDYKDLSIWQQAMDIVAEVYQLTSKFPGDEIYGLTSQMTMSLIQKLPSD
jgi:hypothetical protein